MQEAWQQAFERAVLTRAGVSGRVRIDARGLLGQSLRSRKGRTCPGRKGEYDDRPDQARGDGL
jgi:hypothetical protein